MTRKKTSDNDNNLSSDLFKTNDSDEITPVEAKPQPAPIFTPTKPPVVQTPLAKPTESPKVVSKEAEKKIEVSSPPPKAATIEKPSPKPKQDTFDDLDSLLPDLPAKKEEKPKPKTKSNFIVLQY